MFRVGVTHRSVARCDHQFKSVYHLWQGFTVGAIIVGANDRAHRLGGYPLPPQERSHPQADPVPPPPRADLHDHPDSHRARALRRDDGRRKQREALTQGPNVTINVNAFQWGWKFTYPGKDVVVVGQTTQDPEMVMPVNENVHINLTSSDVIHGFYVHDFNFSRYALPGVLNQFTFRAVETGTYHGQCTQLCGLYHSLMCFSVKVVSAAGVRGVAQGQLQPRRGARGADRRSTSRLVYRADQDRQEQGNN